EPADSQAAGSRFESEGAHLINKVKVRTVVPLRSGQFWCALPQRFADRNEVVASAKNPTEGEVGEVQRASRHDLVRALAPRYGHVSKREGPDSRSGVRGDGLHAEIRADAPQRPAGRITRQANTPTLADLRAGRG